MYRVGILLSGCGELDGSDPAQTVAAYMRIETAGAEVVAFAPDVQQRDSIHPLTGATLSAPRQALAESARLARGACRPAAAVTALHVDALVVPGGLGVVKTLCDVAVSGADATLEPQVARVLAELQRERKPVAALGEAVLLIGLSRREQRLRLACTDPALALLLRELGHEPVAGGPAEKIVDANGRLVSAAVPFGLLASPAMAAATGAVDQLLEWLLAV
jgi:enhancing lycopene biosynthesis protein 2